MPGSTGHAPKHFGFGRAFAMEQAELAILVVPAQIGAPMGETVRTVFGAILANDELIAF